MAPYKEFAPLVLKTGCKINVCLHITGVRENGWHELDSVFLPLAVPFDELHISLGSSGLTVICEQPGLDLKNNTLTSAWQKYGQATNFYPDLNVVLHKQIPQGGGLGGGSADAAALLLWLNDVNPCPLSFEELGDVAVKVGADVKFFLYNCACRVRGIGEHIVPCENMLAGWFGLLICPEVQVSTPWAYQAYDAEKKKEKDLNASLTICNIQDRNQIPQGQILVNDFEKPVFKGFSMLQNYKENLLQWGAKAAVMSGSGACLVGFFENKFSQKAAFCKFEALQRKGLSIYTFELKDC